MANILRTYNTDEYSHHWYKESGLQMLHECDNRFATVDSGEFLIVYSDDVRGGSFSMSFDPAAYDSPNIQAEYEAKRRCDQTHNSLRSVLVLRKSTGNGFVRF